MAFLKFTVRRIRQLAALAVLVVVIMVVLLQFDRSLQRTSYITGWTLLTVVGFLTAFNMRKKLPFLAVLGSARAWTQLHIYFGFVVVILFLFHINFRIPDGTFERWLAGLFLLVSASGFYGLYISRVIPKKLTAVPDEVVFERIPALRNRLSADARNIVFQCAQQAPALAEFYVERLARFFEGPRNVLYFAMPSGRLKRTLMRELDNIDRYLPEDSRAPSQELKDLICRKDDLDFHLAMQGRLKLWLFVHIGTTYGLLIMILMHTVLVHAFHGGLR